jgi:hypothetical protein
MVDHCHEPIPFETKRSRRKADKRLPRLGLRPLDQARRLLASRPKKTVAIWTPEITSDLTPDLPVKVSELDAILQLLGDDLASIIQS